MPHVRWRGASLTGVQRLFQDENPGVPPNGDRRAAYSPTWEPADGEASLGGQVSGSAGPSPLQPLSHPDTLAPQTLLGGLGLLNIYDSGS